MACITQSIIISVILIVRGSLNISSYGVKDDDQTENVFRCFPRFSAVPLEKIYFANVYYKDFFFCFSCPTVNSEYSSVMIHRTQYKMCECFVPITKIITHITRRFYTLFESISI